ncbi:unnamed protein product [Pleuronectes platessa]|uniref:Uncharacterized protein n=1 Tax=Pleuronectes platessa TaxID=8262 RepID=A0A9N7YS39_PLEPL|nr:unnamed protein product [Pleuronectes platessa]
MLPGHILELLHLPAAEFQERRPGLKVKLPSFMLLSKHKPRWSSGSSSSAAVIHEKTVTASIFASDVTQRVSSASWPLRHHTGPIHCCPCHLLGTPVLSIRRRGTGAKSPLAGTSQRGNRAATPKTEDVLIENN